MISDPKSKKHYRLILKCRFERLMTNATNFDVFKKKKQQKLPNICKEMDLLSSNDQKYIQFTRN